MLAVLCAAHVPVAEAGEWALNEKRLVARAGLADAANTIGAGGAVDLDALSERLELPHWP